MVPQAATPGTTGHIFVVPPWDQEALSVVLPWDHTPVLWDYTGRLCGTTRGARTKPVVPAWSLVSHGKSGLWDHRGPTPLSWGRDGFAHKVDLCRTVIAYKTVVSISIRFCAMYGGQNRTGCGMVRLYGQSHERTEDGTRHKMERGPGVFRRRGCCPSPRVTRRSAADNLNRSLHLLHRRLVARARTA